MTRKIPTGYTTFAGWSDVLAHVRENSRVYYWPPLNHRPVLVRATVAGVDVRITPSDPYADPFTADAGHLDRMCLRIKTSE